jgi:ABC-2 type transport system ATP-binding protein
MIGLDPKGQREVREMIRTLANEGTAIVLSSHQLAVIEALADEVVVMAGGLVRAHDTVQGLMAADEGASLEDVLLRLTESPGASPSES